MKIIVSQQDKKIVIEFYHGKTVDNYKVDKAEDFLLVIDKFFEKRDNQKSSIAKADLKFANVSVLTERIIKAIIIGLRF